MMRKLAVLTALISILFTGCAGEITNAQKHEDSALSIVCTMFPGYDWTKEITAGQDVKLTYLLSGGIDMHNYQPSTKDMIAISDCDLLIYVGGESETWIDNVLKESTNPDRQVIRLMDVISDSLKEEEIKEGMQAEEEDSAYDEHIWLSVKNAETLCNAVCDTLCEIQPESAEAYQSNLNAYTQKLNALDKEFETMIEQSSMKTIVFGDRFPFLYLADDYGLDYYAAFAGCSAETEASFQTIAFLAEKLNELNSNTIFTIENADTSVARAVIANTESKNQQIVELNSMQSVSQKEIAGGVSYLTIMQENFNILKEALQ